MYVYLQARIKIHSSSNAIKRCVLKENCSYNETN